MQHGTILFRSFTGKAIQHLRVCCSGIFILSFLSMPLAGCGSRKFPAYKANAFNTYNNQMTKNDLHIAVLPMTDEKEQKRYFGTVLSNMNVLPVFVIAENSSASQSFLLRDDLISLQQKTTKESFSKAVKTNIADDSSLEGVRRVSELVGSIGLSLALAQNSVNTKAIHDNLFDKTLYTQTVLPGKTAEGFAFFKILDNKINLKDLLLCIQISEVDTPLTHSFEFVLVQ